MGTGGGYFAETLLWPTAGAPREHAGDEGDRSLPHATGRERHGPGHEQRRALVDSLEAALRQRHRLDGRPADVGARGPPEPDLAADPLVHEGEHSRAAEGAARAQRRSPLHAVVPPLRLARGEREVELHGPEPFDRVFTMPVKTVFRAHLGLLRADGDTLLHAKSAAVGRCE